MLVFLILKLTLSFGLRTINVDVVPDNNGVSIDNSTIPVIKHQDISGCACDVTDQCDLHCCCDPDCPESVKEEWGKFINEDKDNKCLLNKTNIKESERKALRKCSDPRIKGDGSLLDWVQRTMLCISRNNNPSAGRFFEIKTKSSTDGFAETQSSLSNSFISAENHEEDLLRPLMTDINPTNIYEIGTGKSLFSYLTGLCYNINVDDIDICSDINSTNYTVTPECPDDYEFNETSCFNESNTTDPECPEDYEFNGTTCVLNCTIIKNQSLNFSILYQSSIHNRTFSCNFSDSEENQLETQSEDDLLGYTQVVEILNMSCTTPTSCTAVFRNYTLEPIYNETLTNSTNSTDSAQLLSTNPEENKTLILSFLWPKNENVQNLPRGYYFGDELLDDNQNPIKIDAPGKGNFCGSSKTSLRFGMNVDFTCMTNMPIANCSLENYTVFNESCNIDGVGVTPEFGRILQVPFPSDDDEQPYINYTAPGFQFDYDKAINESNITDVAEDVDSLYLTGILRSIDIFYKTVGYEHNPTHILMDLDVKYDYSTSIKYLYSNFVTDYQHITLRTIVRFYEHPNNLNMFRGSTTNTKLQSWLPFDV